MPGTVLLDDKERVVERKVGAIILAIGSKLYDCRKVNGLGYGEVPGVFTSLEFERLASSSGPTAGEIKIPAGGAPAVSRSSTASAASTPNTSLTVPASAASMP